MHFEHTENKNHVPIRMGDFSVVDREFDNIRERFDAEMRKMEEDMNKFRTELLDREDAAGGGGGNNSRLFNKSASRASHSSFVSSVSGHKKVVGGKEVLNETSSFSSSSQQSNDVLSGSGLGQHSNWLQGLNSPLIRNSEEVDGQKELKLRFDVSQYSPEEIMVKTVDNKLLVHAKHEEKGEGKSVYREYNREFLLPAGTDPESIRSSLSKDGILTVEAPLPQPAIAHHK